MTSRFLALVRKEFTQIIRDRRTLGIVLIQPAILLMLFGYAINTNVEHVSTVILNQSDDRMSREFTEALINSGVFTVPDQPQVHDPDSVRQAVDSGVAKVGVIIPPNFERDLLSARPVAVQVLIDGSDPNIAQSALASVTAIGQIRSALVLASSCAIMP